MTARFFRFATACGCLVLAWREGALRADDPAPPTLVAGHSAHGETFNDGPRQRAHLMGNTGRVNFHATTANSEAQEFINQGIGQLHGFWYFEAERSFRQAATLDPQCAMAYWGMALANTSNAKRAKGFLAEAVKRKTGMTERETMYIDALDAFHKVEGKKTEGRRNEGRKTDGKNEEGGNDKARYEAYAKSFEKIIYKNPTDVEAKALLGLQLWLNRSHGSPISSHLAIDALHKEVLAVEPLHPCHHYRIHLWDDERPQNAVESAARCGQAAPSIAHMWHMSGHIFSDLQRYADAAWQQEASARVDHAYMLRDHVLPDQIHNYAHNNEWLIRDLAHVGRARDAVRLARNMIEIPRHPKYNTLTSGSANLGRLRLFDELVRFELWDDLLALAETPYLEPTDVAAEQVKRLRYMGIALLRKGDIAGGLAQIRTLEERLRHERHKLNVAEPPVVRALVSAPVAGDEPRPDPVLLPTPEENTRFRPIELAIDELRGHLAVEQGDYRAGLPLLKKAGGVAPLYLARVDFLAGNRDAGLKEARNVLDRNKNQVQPLADAVELLWRAGEEKEAAENFQKLREIAGQADVDIPVLARLAPIAASLNHPTDWRIAKPAEPDVGDRPPLESLGPMLWQPYAASDWELSDGKGGRIGSAQYRGKPVVVIFYLGFQCLHCAEQLQAFAPLVKDFEEAGISLVAISTDDDSGLAKSVEKFKPGVFPFPLASDPALEIFKLYRAHDDFENRPLHATFFIDGAGLVRWQDISFEPFRDGRFVLNEARRLMKISATNSSIGRPASLSAGIANAPVADSTEKAP